MTKKHKLNPADLMRQKREAMGRTRDWFNQQTRNIGPTPVPTPTPRFKKKHKGMVPATAKGKAQVKKLGRTKKTGGFAKIAAKAGTKYGSPAAGKRVAGAIFQKMVKARGGK
jgi:hypothetical protein